MTLNPLLARSEYEHRRRTFFNDGILDSDGDLLFLTAGPDPVDAFNLLCGFHLDFILEPERPVSASNKRTVLKTQVDKNFPNAEMPQMRGAI